MATSSTGEGEGEGIGRRGEGVEKGGRGEGEGVRSRGRLQALFFQCSEGGSGAWSEFCCRNWALVCKMLAAGVARVEGAFFST
jgi:hypothetical protein